LRDTNVSIEIVPSASPWPPSKVRWMSASPEAQRPMTYHFVMLAALVVPRIWTCTQVPAGVSAFQDATSSVEPKPGAYIGDVQVALS
jgi:hypothetical protein